jgi:transposase-like protein
MIDNYIPEVEVAKRMGLTRQTLRNWRRGYQARTGAYPAKLTEGEQWVKIGATVVYSAEWVEKMERNKQEKAELLSI